MNEIPLRKQIDYNYLRNTPTVRTEIKFQAIPLSILFRNSPFRGVLRKICFESTQQIYRRTPMPKRDFNNVALQFYRNSTSAWVLSCK